MRDGYTHRVCPSCGAVETTERVTCEYCGSLTVPRSPAQSRAMGGSSRASYCLDSEIWAWLKW